MRQIPGREHTGALVMAMGLGLPNTGGLDSQPRTDDEEEIVRDAAKGDRPAQSLGRADIERSVTGGSVEGRSRRLGGPAARGEVGGPIDRDRASSYAQSGGARRGTHPT